MPNVRDVTVALLLATIFACQPAQAQGPLPPDWLATLTIRDPLETLSRVQGMAADAGLPVLGKQWLPLLAAPDLKLAGGSVTVGVAAPGGELERLHLFATTPTPPAALVETFGGDLTGDIGIFTVGGIEFASRVRGGVTMVAPFDRQSLLQDDLGAAAAQPEPTHDLTLRVSQQGLDQLRQRVELQHAGRSRGQRIALNEPGWPPSARWIDAAIGGNLPLAERVSELFREVSLGVSLTDEEVSVEVFAAELGSNAATTGAGNQQVAPRLGDSPRLPIATLAGDARSGALRTLMSVWLAYCQGRPDELEASVYPGEEYAEFEARTLAAVGMVTAADAVLLTRTAEDPFYSNRAAVLLVSDAEQFLAEVRAATDAWNLTVAASDARIKLAVQVDEEQFLGEDQPPVTRFVSDLGVALEDPPSAATQAIMRRYYGVDGLHVGKLAVLGDTQVLLADVPTPEFRELAAGVRPGQPPGGLSGRVWLDRYAAWQNAVLSDYMADAIGFTAPKQLPESPLAIAIGRSDRAITVRVSAERTTALNLGRRLVPSGVKAGSGQ